MVKNIKINEWIIYDTTRGRVGRIWLQSRDDYSEKWRASWTNDDGTAPVDASKSGTSYREMLDWLRLKGQPIRIKKLEGK